MSENFTPALHAEVTAIQLGRPMSSGEVHDSEIADHNEGKIGRPGATAEALITGARGRGRGRRQRLDREGRKKRRAERTRGRKRLMRIAEEVYEEGDTQEDLREKISAVLEDGDVGGDRPFMDFLMALLEQLLPLLIQMFLGGMTGGLI